MSRYHRHRADELEEEIRRSRAHLDDTLHELESRLSPPSIKQSVKRHLPRSNGAGAGFLRNLGRSIRENPLPVLVTGVGLGWLLVSQLRTGSRGQRRADALATGARIPARQEAPQRMVATHLGTQQGGSRVSTHRPDVVGVATHLGTGQGWSGYVYPQV
ncbi:DUF3618 domain-containing protein [Billgrantia kenyensis]|uniref:DUF3618 domain-containing protein n=1 Tax=Billgrantia kenyensis TaxID=321266 RepID=A0A7V9W3F5_9GAMM|nr:DUF3618 domain-containing protein [Halomonas kenyensis]MBA2780269.1 DUF3618 domain-containing protein [Halomonas kenyensis]MCG6663185.1 DUF3618 domain-containing protein [Halomonas kenyensis]